MTAIADGERGVDLKYLTTAEKQGLLYFSSSMERATARVLKVKALRIKQLYHKYNPQ
jgi:hypothetical protein